MFKGLTGISRKKASGDVVHEVEQQFILRMPPEVSQTLRTEVANGAASLADNLSIEMLPDMRRALIRYGRYIYNAKLVDLPCIVESLKTIDRKTFYKTADISQMLACTEEEEASAAEEPMKKKDKDRRHAWNHGLTPPLKNVRRRRFRKTLTKKYNEQPDIEKEVRQLFRMDAEAIDVKWEVIAEDSGAAQSPSRDDSLNDEGPTNYARIPRIDTNTSLADIDLFGELSSSDEDEKDVNIVDSGDEDTGVTMNPASISRDSPMIATEDENGGISAKDQELLQMRIESLAADLESLRNQRMEQESQMATVDDPALQQHYQGILDKLVEEENEKEVEYQMIMSMASDR